jgi:hypothetical protein
MPISQDNFNSSLYDLLKSRGYKPTPIDSKGKNTQVPQEADVFRFDFIKAGKNYGDVWATIDDGKDLVIYYNENVKDSPKDNTTGTEYSDSFDALLKHLKNWAQRRQLGFELKNKDHLSNDMALRDHMKKKEQLGEAYHPMGKKASYNDSVPQVKIILQHTRQLEEGEQRFRNIERIFVENTSGERFLIPTTRPGIARVYGRHIAEGGTPYDERGKHITSLVEEYTKMAGFVRATKNGQFNESALRLVNEGVSHYSNLRETLTRMASRRGYNNYFASYTPVLNEETDDATTLNELFVEETLDPRIESVMPILKRLQKNITEMNEVNELAEWAESITEVEDETTKTLAEPASEMLDEAPGAETLKHNQNTEKSNLKAFDLGEDDMEEGIKDVMKSVRKKFRQSAIGRAKEHGYSIEEGFSPSEEVADQIVDSLGGESNLTSGDVYRAVEEYQTMMDSPHKLDTDEVVQIVMDRLNITDDIEEGLDANQKTAGQLGPTEPVGKDEKNLRGKLVGASESIELNDIRVLSGIAK